MPKLLLSPSPFWLECRPYSITRIAPAHSAIYSAAAFQVEARLLESLREAELAEAMERAAHLQLKIAEMRELLEGG